MSQLPEPDLEHGTSLTEMHGSVKRHLVGALEDLAKQRLAPDSPAADSVPSKRICIHITLEENFHHAVKKLLVTYGDTWQSTIQGLLTMWVQVNVNNGVLAWRDIERIPNIGHSEPQPQGLRMKDSC